MTNHLSSSNKKSVNNEPKNYNSFLTFRKTINNQYNQASINAFHFHIIGLDIGGYVAY